MSQQSRAVHMSTSEGGVAPLIDAWLARHNLDVVACHDALAVVEELLCRPEHVPLITFIDLARLAPDEYRLLTYLRETWPGLAVVAYGQSGSAPSFEDQPPGDAMFLACRTSQQFSQVFRESPEELVARMRGGGPGRDGQPPAPPVGGQRAAASPPPSPAPPPDRYREQLAATLARGRAFPPLAG